MKSKTRVFDTNWKNKDVVDPLRDGKFKGVILDPTGSQAHNMRFKPHQEGVDLTPPRPKPYAGDKNIETDKLFEAQELPGLIPKAISVTDALRRGRIDIQDPDSARGLHGAISKVLDSKNFILKPSSGAAVPGSKLPTESSDPLNTAKSLMDGVYSAINKTTFGKGPHNWMAQERVDLQPASYIDRLANTAYNLGTTTSPIPGKEKMSLLIQALKGKKVNVEGATSVSGNNMNEYRAHVVNGKVIPNGSIFRGGVLGSLPWVRKDSLSMEKEVQRQLDELMPEKYRKGSFGLDVAKKRDGGWQVIETNPASATAGSSGFLGHPQVVDAMHSAVMGKVPSFYNTQRNITNGINATGKITGGLGLGYLGANSFTRFEDK